MPHIKPIPTLITALLLAPLAALNAAELFPTPAALWKVYDPNHGELKEEIVKQETRDGIFSRDSYISAYVLGEEIRVYCRYKVKAGAAKAPGLLVVHGWMGAAEPDRKFVEDGWAVMAHDYCGKTGTRPHFTKYPEKLRHGNMDRTVAGPVRAFSPSTADAVDDVFTGGGTTPFVLPTFTAPALPAGVTAAIPGTLARIFALIAKVKLSAGCTDAIGGAVGAIFWLEPFATKDLDVFVTLPTGEGSSLLTLGPIYSYLMSRGYQPSGQFIVIEGWAVEFVPPATPLVEEALEKSVKRDVNGIDTRVFTAEHLAAICLQVGRAKDYDRVVRFLEAEVIDAAVFESILQRHELMPQWQKFQSTYLEP